MSVLSTFPPSKALAVSRFLRDKLKLSVWGKHYLGKRITDTLSSFHYELTDDLDRLRVERGRKLCRQAPRSSAKTTWANIAHPLRCALEGTETFTIITSDRQPKAREFLENIRREAESNPKLLRDYPESAGVGPVWNADRLRFRNGCEIEAISTGTSIRGVLKETRPTLVIGDDLQGPDDMISAVERGRAWDWLTKDLLSIGDPNTNFLILGTAIHQDAIVCKLQKQPGWDTRVYRNLVKPPIHADLWEVWADILLKHENKNREKEAEEYYIKNQTKMNAGSEVLWPSRYSLYYLMTQKSTLGTAAFESEHQNNPIDPALCEWPESYFSDSIWFTDWPADAFTIKTISVDPSKGRDAKHGDYCAIVKMGRDRDGYIYIEADLQRISAETIVENVIEHHKTFKGDAVAVESNQYQELLVSQIADVSRRRGVMVPVVPMENMVKKEVRIRRLGPYLAKKLFRFRATPGTRLLVQQMQQFPLGDYDDGPDALEMGLRVMIETYNGRQKQIPHKQLRLR